MNRSMVWLSIAVAVTTIGRTLAAPAPDATSRPVVLPGGVADADGKTGYVVNEKGGISALDLESGKVLWTREGPGKPLIAFEKKLAIQVPVKDKENQVRVEILDTSEKGKRLREGDAVVFPEWVGTGLTHGRSFSSNAFVQGNKLYLKWEAHAFYAGGARPTEEIIKAAKKDADGVASVHLETGKVELLDKDKQPQIEDPKLPDELAKITSRQYFTGTDWLQKPIIVGSTLAALAQDNAGDKQKLTLKTWDLASGKSKEPVELLTGKELWLLIPSGSKHLFVHQALPKEKLADEDYAWWIYSLETGKQEAKIPFEGAMDLRVVGPRLFYMVSPPQKIPPNPGGFLEQPRSLKAVDLKTGKVIWESPLEPTRHLPPVP